MTLVFMAALLVCSGFVSGSETAVFSLSAAERRALAQRTPLVKSLLARPGRLLVTLLLANLIINVGYFTLSASVSLELLQSDRGGLALGVAVASLGAMVVLGEIVPKTLALADGLRIVRGVSPALSILSFVLAPLVWVGAWVTEIVERLLFGARSRPAVRAADLKAMLGDEGGDASERRVEFALLSDVIDFGELKAKALMVPRVDMAVLDLAEDRAAWVAVMAEQPHTDYPVIDGSPDKLLGVVNATRVMLETETPLEELVEPALLAPLSLGAERLVLRMIHEDCQLAVLLDEFGGVAGLVGRAELAQELLGEVDTERMGPVERLGNGSALVMGRCPVHRLEEELGPVFTSRRAGTVGGAVAEALSAVPRRGDELRLGNWSLRVLSMDGGRVGRLLVKPEPASERELEGEDDTSGGTPA